MNVPHHPKLNRRDLLKLSGMAGLTALGRRAAFADAAGSVNLACAGTGVIEAFPTTPLILNPFTDPLVIPTPLAPVAKSVVNKWSTRPGPGIGQQDSDGGTHQMWPSSITYNGKALPDPLIYQIKLQVATHSFSSSPVQVMVTYFDPKGNVVTSGTQVKSLPNSTIYGFNGTFPGPMIYANYGQPALVRFENHLNENPSNLDRQDFGAPDLGFLTHLHNGHTAPESDGNPHYKPQAYQPGEWVDNLYLNWPAAGDDREKQSFFWFHDHRMDHTGANVYKGMAGIYPIYDPVNDSGDETKGYRLPGVLNTRTGRVDYDIPLILYDCRLDDGNTPHKDWHNGCGELHPEWWGMSYFRHFPNHGFVGDLFTVNGTAYPVMNVDRRKYRFRFLDASISRIYELKLMSSTGGPKSALSLGLVGDALDGQWRIPDGQQAMQFFEIAADGGLLTRPLLRDSFQLWPAKRREFIVDFTKYMDGSPTKKGDVVYLTDILSMSTGREPDEIADPTYKVPILKFVIGDLPKTPDNSLIPTTMRQLPPLPDAVTLAGLPHRTFTLVRGSFGGELEWGIDNGSGAAPFNPSVSFANPQRGKPEVWTIQNGGGGWVHPLHIHMEEHQVLFRNGIQQPDDPLCKEDVVALQPSEAVTFYRNFRTFTGPYVCHCHNLAHEDHAMMFGWTIVP
jgi:FtsP/CotA-like multicopper oxidase with cupredoxin domain